MSMLGDIFQNQYSGSAFTLKKMLSSWQLHQLNSTENDLKQMQLMANPHLTAEHTVFLPDYELVDDVKHSEFIKIFDNAKSNFIQETVSPWSEYLSRPECTPLLDFMDAGTQNPKLHVLNDLFSNPVEPEVTRWKNNRDLRVAIKLGRPAQMPQHDAPFSYQESELLERKCILQLQRDIDEIENPPPPPPERQDDRPQEGGGVQRPARRRYGAKGTFCEMPKEVMIHELADVKFHQRHLSELAQYIAQLVNIFRFTSDGGKILAAPHCPISELVSILSSLMSYLRDVEVLLAKNGEVLSIVLAMVIENPGKEAVTNHEYKMALNLASDLFLNIGQVIILLASSSIHPDEHASDALGSLIDLYIYLLHFEPIKKLLDGFDHGSTKSWNHQLVPKLAKLGSRYTDNRDSSKGSLVRAYLQGKGSFNDISCSTLYRTHAPEHIESYIWMFDASEIHVGLSWLLNYKLAPVHYCVSDISKISSWKLDSVCHQMRKHHLSPLAQVDYLTKYVPTSGKMAKAIQMDTEMRDQGIRFGMKGNNRFRKEYEQPRGQQPSGKGYWRANDQQKANAGYQHYGEIYDEQPYDNRRDYTNRNDYRYDGYEGQRASRQDVSRKYRGEYSRTPSRSPPRKQAPSRYHRSRTPSPSPPPPPRRENFQRNQPPKGTGDARGNRGGRRGGAKGGKHRTLDDEFNDLLNCPSERFFDRRQNRQWDKIERDAGEAFRGGFDPSREAQKPRLAYDRDPGIIDYFRGEPEELIEENVYDDAMYDDIEVNLPENNSVDDAPPAPEQEPHIPGSLENSSAENTESEEEENNSQSGEGDNDSGEEESSGSSDFEEIQPAPNAAGVPQQLAQPQIGEIEPLLPDNLMHDGIELVEEEGDGRIPDQGQVNNEEPPLVLQAIPPPPFIFQDPRLPNIFNGRLALPIPPPPPFYNGAPALAVPQPPNVFYHPGLRNFFNGRAAIPIPPAPPIYNGRVALPIPPAPPIYNGRVALPIPAPPNLVAVLAHRPERPAGPLRPQVQAEMEPRVEVEAVVQEPPLRGEPREDQPAEAIRNVVVEEPVPQIEEEPREVEGFALIPEQGGPNAGIRERAMAQPPRIDLRGAFEDLGQDAGVYRALIQLQNAPIRRTPLIPNPLLTRDLMDVVADPVRAPRRYKRAVDLMQGPRPVVYHGNQERFGLLGNEDYSVATEGFNPKGVRYTTVTTTAIFPFNQNRFNQMFGSPVETRYIQAISSNNKYRYSLDRIRTAFDEYANLMQRIPKFRTTDRPRAVIRMDFEDYDEMLDFYREYEPNQGKEDWLKFTGTESYRILKDGGHITSDPFPRPRDTNGESLREPKARYSIPVIYPAQATRSWINALSSLKLLWLNRANQRNHIPLYPKANVSREVVGSPKVLAIGVARVDDATRTLYSNLSTTLMRFLSEQLSTLADGLVPSTSIFVSKDRQMHTRDGERISRSRYEAGLRCRELEMDKFFTPHTLEAVYNDLNKKFLDVQPVITSRPGSAVPCDELYNKTHPIKKFFTETSGKLGTAFIRYHRKGRVEDCYPGGCPDIMALRANDVHYYFNNQTFDNFPETDLYLTGMNYTHQWPGSYRYNWNCGSYKISPETDMGRGLATYKIDVLTAGSGGSNLYSHPLNNVCNTTKEMDLGWASIIEFTGAASSIRFNRVVGPNHYDPHLNPQALWMNQQAAKSTSLDLTGQFSRNIGDKETLWRSYRQFEQVVSKMYFVKCPSDLDLRVTYLTGLLGMNSPGVFTFKRKNEGFLTRLIPCCKTVWHVSKSQALTPEEVRGAGFWRALLKREKDAGLFTEYQNLRANFGAKAAVLEWSSQDHVKVAENYGRIEVQSAQEVLWDKPYSNGQAISNKEVAEERSAKSQRLNKKPEKSDIKEAEPNDEPQKQIEMVPLYCEVRRVNKEQIILSRSSDNIENAKLVSILKKNVDMTKPITLVEKNYPKIGYTALTDKLRTIHNWTIDDKNPLSMLSAVHARHFSAQLSPDPLIVKEFDAFTDRFISGIAYHVNEMLKMRTVDKNFLEHYAAKEYTDTKKDDYIKNCYRQLFYPDREDFSFSFMGMVKSGEINYTKGELQRDTLGYITSGSERARLIWNPSQSGKGLLNYVQHYIFDCLHDACPDFIHGASTGDIRDATVSRVESMQDPISISLDGSSYDSTQFQELMAAVDTKFFAGIEEGIDHIMKSCAQRHGAPEWTRENTKKLISSATDSKATLFVNYPSSWLKGYRMTAEQSDLLKRHWPKHKPHPGNATAAYNVTGTTFSGHPTKTTLGNTLRTLSYYRFAFSALTNVQMMAAGDDIVCWIERGEAMRAVQRVSYISKKDAAIGEHGLGQVVKSIEIREKYDLDFCSKNFFYTEQSGLVVTRDVEKLMKTKLSAQTKFQPFIRDPQAYVTLIYKSALAEIPCPLIHQILLKRVKELGGLKDPTPSQVKMYRIIEKANYKRHQDEDFHQKCLDLDLQELIVGKTKIYEVDIFDYSMMATNTLRFGAKTPVPPGNKNTTQPHMSYYDERSPYETGTGRNYNRNRSRRYEDSFTDDYRDYRGNRMNQSFASQRERNEPIQKRNGPPGKGGKFKKTETRTILGTDPKTHTPVEKTQVTTTTTNPDNSKTVVQKETTAVIEPVSVSARPKPQRPRAYNNLMADRSWMIPESQRTRFEAHNVAAMGQNMNSYTDTPAWDTMARERTKVRNGTRAERTEYYTNHPQPGTLAPFNQNGPLIQESVNEALSDTDRFMLAKFLPGKIDTPFMNGLQRVPIPTGKFSTSFSLDTAATAASPDVGQSVLGTYPYLMMAYCPALSLSLGSGQPNAHPTNTHLSGFATMQGALNDVPLFTDIFDRTNRSPSLFALLGTNFDTFSSNGLIFASQIDLRLMCPAANLVGAMYTGACTLASIPPGGLSFAKLLQTSTRVESGATNLTLRGALVNNGLVTTALTPNSNDTFADFSNEIVHYIILQNPVVSITTGQPSPYSLISNAHGNYVWWPTQLDAFANKLGSGDVSTANVNPTKSSFLHDALYTPLLDAGKLVGRNLLSTAGNIARNLVGSIPLVGSVLSQAFGSSFKSRVKSSNDNATIVAEKAWAYRWIDEFLRLEESVQIEVFKTYMSDLKPQLQHLRAAVDAWPEPLVPISISWLESKQTAATKGALDADSKFTQPKLVRTKPVEIMFKQPIHEEDESFHTLKDEDADYENAMERDAAEYSKFRLMKQQAIAGTGQINPKDGKSNASSRQASNEPNVQMNLNLSSNRLNSNS